MADKKIKGIVIEIGGDTVGLQKALADVNKQGNSLRSELSAVERLLKFDPGNTEALAQKQTLLAQQVENTTKKLEQLKQAQEQVEQQAKSGDIGEDQYRAFQREVQFTEAELKKFKQRLDSMDDTKSIGNLKNDLKGVSKEAGEAEKSIKDMGVELENVAGALVAGGGIAGAIEQALDTSTLNTKIDVTFDVPEESKASIKDAVRDIEAYGVDAEASLEGVRRQWALNKDASDTANAQIVKGAAAISQVYSGVDFTELIQETNEVASGLDISNEEALGLFNSLLKAGFPPEQLDTVAEYGMQMKNAGFSAQEIQAIFEKGINTKSWNVDNLNDGVKEARIRMAEFGQEVPKTMTDLLSKTDVSAKQFQTWGKMVATGGADGSKAMGEMSEWLAGIEDKTLQNSLATQIFGTMWEDQGTNLTSILSGVADSTDKTKQNMQGVNDTVAQMDASPAVAFQQAVGNLKTALEPLFLMISNIIAIIAQWIKDNPTLAATITAIVTAIGILMGIFLALSPIITAITSLAGALGVGIGAIAGPIGIAIAAIAAIIAIGVLLYKNWDEIKAFLSTIWESIKTIAVAVWDSVKAFFVATWEGIKAVGESVWNGLKSFFEGIWNGIKAVAVAIWDGIKAYFTTVLGIYKTIFTTAWNTIKDVLSSLWNGIKTVAVAVWDGIKTYFTTILNAYKTIFTTVWSGIKTFFGETLGNIWSKVKEVFGNIWTSINEKMNSIKTTISDIWNSIKDWLSGKLGDFKNIGINLITGLWNGIKEKITWLKGKIEEFGEGIKEKMKSIFGIHSPSKVFAEYGSYMGEGLAIGLNKANGVVKKATVQMSDVVIDNSKATLGSGTTTTNSGFDYLKLAQALESIMSPPVVINYSGQGRSQDDIIQLSKELKRLLDMSKNAKGVR